MSALATRWTAWLLAFGLCLAAGFATGEDLQPVPPLTARVTDVAGVLTVEQRQRLEARLRAFEREKGAQIAVVIVATAKPEAIEQYALRVAEVWKLGRKGVDDGALLLVARNDRKLRIEVGYGLEGVLNDATAKRIISDTIAPLFKQGDFYGGIAAGVEAMIKVIDRESLPTLKNATASTSGEADDFLPVLVLIGGILVFVVGGILRAILGRFLAAGVVGGAAGVLASVWVSWVLALVAGLLAFVASLLLGSSLAGSRWSSPRGGHGWGGFSGGGFSGGGFSSGSDSFSGGDGGFGGGGASGGW